MGMNIAILKSFEKYVKNQLNEDIKHSKLPYPCSISILIELEFTEPKDFKILQTGYPVKKALEKYIKDKNITFIGLDQDIEYNPDYYDADRVDYIKDEDVEFYYYIGNDDKAIDSSINDLRKEAGDQVAEDFINLIVDEMEEEIEHQKANREE